MTSSMTVVVIASERYIALFHRIRSVTQEKKKHVAIPLLLVWILPLGLSVFIFDTRKTNIGVAIYTSCSMMSLMWIAIVYARIYMCIRRMKRSITFEKSQEDTAKHRAEAAARRQTHLSRFIAVIMAVYLFFNIPFSVFMMVIYSGVFGASRKKHIEVYAYTFIMGNSLVNPIIYAWQNPQIGKRMLQLWHVQ